MTLCARDLQDAPERSPYVFRLLLASHSEVLSAVSPSSYDRLFAATGVRPFVPPLKNVSIKDVRCLRTLHDAQVLLSRVRPEARVVVIGGGILGLSRPRHNVAICGSNHL